MNLKVSFPRREGKKQHSGTSISSLQWSCRAVFRCMSSFSFRTFRFGFFFPFTPSKLVNAGGLIDSLVATSRQLMLTVSTQSGHYGTRVPLPDQQSNSTDTALHAPLSIAPRLSSTHRGRAWSPPATWTFRLTSSRVTHTGWFSTSEDLIQICALGISRSTELHWLPNPVVPQRCIITYPILIIY